MWQAQARRRLFDIYALVYWGLRARMVEVVEQLKATAERQGRSLTARIGERTKAMKMVEGNGAHVVQYQVARLQLGPCRFPM